MKNEWFESKKRPEIISEIVRKVTGDKNAEINRSSTARDVRGWGSQAHMTIILETEQYFALRLSVIEVAGMTCIGDLLDILSEKLDCKWYNLMKINLHNSKFECMFSFFWIY